LALEPELVSKDRLSLSSRKRTSYVTLPAGMTAFLNAHRARVCVLDDPREQKKAPAVPGL
jgi:hypothetical protein